MTVYAVYERDWEFHEVEAIFSTCEKAELYVGDNPDFSVKEMEIDVTDPPNHCYRKVYCAELELLSCVSHGNWQGEDFELLPAGEEIARVEFRKTNDDRRWGNRYALGYSTRSYEHAVELAEAHRQEWLLKTPYLEGEALANAQSALKRLQAVTP